MKKNAIVLFLCLLFMCSCSTDQAIYVNQEKIETNYNNVTNYSDFWLTTDSICYLGDSLVQNYFLVDQNTKTKIDVNGGYGFGRIQRYEEKIYMLDQSAFIDECNSKYELKLYDINSKKTEKICSVNNCDNFLVLNESIYYLEYNWFNDDRMLVLKRFWSDSEKHTTIGSNIISFGVIEDCLCYAIEENDIIVIFKYDAQNDKSVKCGDFSIEGIDFQMFDNNLKASYTSRNMFISWIDYENETTTILKYSFDQGDLSYITVKGYNDGFVSYDKNSYFIVSSEKSDKSELYKLDNETNDITQIAVFHGVGSLFVGSDEGAYVLEHNCDMLKYYSNGGESHIVYRFK